MWNQCLQNAMEGERRERGREKKDKGEEEWQDEQEESLDVGFALRSSKYTGCLGKYA
jgi:hypothetical protein